MLEKIIKNCDKKFIIGIDECGVGCLAGPVTVCAFKASKEWALQGLRDSKKLTEKKRKTFAATIKEDQSIYGFTIQWADSKEIDEFGIQNVIHELYYKAIVELEISNSLIIVDGADFKERRYDRLAIPGGDDIIPHVSAASVIAKTSRDNYMRKMHDKFPNYGWNTNVGYGSAKHIQAIKEYGITEMHRKSFEPMKSMVKL